MSTKVVLIKDEQESETMPENRIKGNRPLWLLIEKEIQKFQPGDFSQEQLPTTAKKIAEELDQTDYNVSKSAGNWMQLNNALKACHAVGRPFMKDLDEAVAALTLDNTADTHAATWRILNSLNKDWPFAMEAENRSDIGDIVHKQRADLVIARAKELGGEQGVRFLISESFDEQKIIEIMAINPGDYKAVRAKVDAELTEIKRVKSLLEAVADADEEAKIKHLFTEDVSEELILKIGGFNQAAVDNVKVEFEAELAEKKRKEEELAAKKAAEAAGPSLDEISADDMLTYIESIREILEFASEEKEIRVMCEQSSIPKALIEIAVSEPDKLDELEKKAEG